MAYTTLADMVARWGEAEMVRLTAPEGQLDDVVVTSRVERALAEASGLIDSYLRTRYAVPLLAPVPAEVARACAVLARFDLAHGEQREPSEQMRLARKDTIAWLEAIAAGRAMLDGAVPSAASPVAGAMVSDRDRIVAAADRLGW